MCDFIENPRLTKKKRKENKWKITQKQGINPLWTIIYYSIKSYLQISYSFYEYLCSLYIFHACLLLYYIINSQ